MSIPAGRFAPSPTGPLHSGSLLAAAASYLDARSRGERWLLRIDDLDVFRNAAGAETTILKALESHGLFWDGPVSRQSDRIGSYQAALEKLAALDGIFYCGCSRRRLKKYPVYPGICRQRTSPLVDTAVRARVADAVIDFEDLIAGSRKTPLADTCGDFIVRRRDGLIAYQLATAVDDGDPAITHVVRGGDLLDNTARQIYLMEALNLTPPVYAHLPTLTGADGQKLSKHTHAPALDNSRPSHNLIDVFGFLSLRPPPEAKNWPPADLLSWGVENWSIGTVTSGNRVFRHQDGNLIPSAST